jgi:hypothetical protein
VSEKYRKKIELMVRKPDRGDDPAEPLLACPFCQLPGPASQLQCVSCQNIIPLDIATGEAREWRGDDSGSAPPRVLSSSFRVGMLGDVLGTGHLPSHESEPALLAAAAQQHNCCFPLKSVKHCEVLCLLPLTHMLPLLQACACMQPTGVSAPSAASLARARASWQCWQQRAPAPCAVQLWHLLRCGR